MNTSVTTVTVPTPQMRAHAPRDDALWMTPLELVMPSFTNECSVTLQHARTANSVGRRPGLFPMLADINFPTSEGKQLLQASLILT